MASSVNVNMISGGTLSASCSTSNNNKYLTISGLANWSIGIVIYSWCLNF